MITNTDDFRNQLMRLDPYVDEFVLHVDQLVEQLAPEIADSVYPAIFEFFETAPDADCGAPGTLVHHVERYYPNYLPALKASVRRKPSYNGVLMINRILSSNLDAVVRNELMEILRVTVADQAVPDEIIEMVEGLIERRERIDREAPI
ncbi:hypothetical protein SAMN02745166_01177 [Prosthecobacter debontii]|uniref:Uncharacterized protein n=1 Tax=Prosthecobacter debontii TaxID=48467 RepID=A0A1T4X9S9_9BACT|nr:hypothetical protein [Prosthecobacter debontii]SKA85651.1 hypothetical protein SAMN02745166_01177 [Prosthecobacter debontii]